MKSAKLSVLCALLVLLAAPLARAQQFTGGLRGVVRDANGVIPGVPVTLTNDGTNISREVVTSEAGQYNFMPSSSKQRGGHK